ncbi:HIT domain-containing protein [Mumia sp. zg.B53]|uniref:HIT family protein n=1 Tax=unclassified Mumia TaxID=2621872 RepID=UPI001C6EA3F7|nr:MULTISPECIES: HIT domain-containing protein [unclassified Mumia]MBW9206079.1 HIT domain-containing protein [Mumia sp. zg.B17]MBW9211639.1 HIT domain-containing protein [Mumia sp. zg.B21]MBW9216799.1 HIT domain-containing protein [Mumia sp. zg.B53]MDD9349335.1 HIT domain-containing protein [Mumia sp.]
MTSGHDAGDSGPWGRPETGFEDFDRLWTPHRMAYITDTGPREGGCPFCVMQQRPDEETLIVARGDHVYTVLNLHPYNPGHLMVVPNRHVGELEELTDDEAWELTATTQQALRVLKHVSAPAAFNVGLNLGAVAGGSLSQHLHQHVVPRWMGDSNYITVTGHTKVMPQLLSQTRDLLAKAWNA